MLQGRNPTEAELRNLVKEVNVDGDGTIGLPGFLAIMQCKTCHDVPEEMRVSPEAYDEDADGYSTDSEMAPRRQSSGVQVAL
jgi:calmodulin